MYGTFVKTKLGGDFSNSEPWTFPCKKFQDRYCLFYGFQRQAYLFK